MYTIVGSILLKIYRKLHWKENIFKKEAYNQLQQQNKSRQKTDLQNQKYHIAETQKSRKIAYFY